MFRTFGLLLLVAHSCHSFVTRSTISKLHLETEDRKELSTSQFLVKKDDTGTLINIADYEIIEDEDYGKGDHISTWVNQAVLVAGTTVGAGVLALPEVAQPSGIIPSVMALSVTWAFMVCTGLLYAEIGSNLRAGDGQDEALGVLNMIDRILGESVSKIAGIVYLFIHYTLLVAYISEAGNIINDTFSVQNIGSPVFAILSGAILLFGSEKLIDNINSASLAIVLTSFFSLAFIGGDLFDADYALSTQNFGIVSSALPIMLLALVYHNVVPVITQQLNYDRSKIQKAIVYGTTIPLAMFIIWIVVILGTFVPLIVILEVNFFRYD